MYSRLEHHERRRLLRQTILFSAGGVGLCVAFLFVILPAFIKVLALKNLGSKLAYEETNVPPSRPTLEQPFNATSSASVSLKGYAQANLKVVLLQNGAPGPETNAGESGDFTFENVSLQAGENTFTAVSENDKDIRSNPSSAVTISYVKDAPKVEISEPQEGAVITQRKQNPISVKGKTDRGNKVFINDRTQFVSNDGSFSGAVQLTDGDNTITVKVLNAASIETIQEIHVRFAP